MYLAANVDVDALSKVLESFEDAESMFGAWADWGPTWATAHAEKHHVEDPVFEDMRLAEAVGERATAAEYECTVHIHGAPKWVN